MQDLNHSRMPKINPQDTLEPTNTVWNRQEASNTLQNHQPATTIQQQAQLS